MQELRSTEILDKEIQDDARKKAEKILKQADFDCEEILSSVDGNIEKAKSEKKDFYNKKVEVYKLDKNASMPLEKERFKVAYISESLSEYINKYLQNLTEEKRFELVVKDFNFNLNNEKKYNAYVYGFDLKNTKKFLSEKLGKNFNKCEETEFGKIVLEDSFGLENPQGFILETEDKSFRARLTLSEVVARVLDKNRAELAEVLFS